MRPIATKRGAKTPGGRPVKRALILGVAALALALPAAALAKDAAYKAPRTSYGQPDIGGAWTNAPLTPQSPPALSGTRKAALQQASVDIFAGQGSVAAGRAGSYDNPESRGVGERCLIGFGRNGGPPMFPNGWYNNNYQIQQSPTRIAIDIEMVHDVRLI